MAKRELSDFEKEFAARRAAGEKTFKYKGTTYTTETKEEEDARKAAARKTTPAPSVSGRPRGGDASEQAPAKSAPAPAPVADETPSYPTAAQRFSQIKQSLADQEAENVRKTAASAEEGRKTMENLGKTLRKRFGTQAMRDEESYKKGGSVKPRGWGGARGGKSCKIC